MIETHYSVYTGNAPTGVVPVHGLHHTDTGSYLHPVGHEEPVQDLHQDRGSYLEILDIGVYLHAPEDEPSREGMS